jgi:hypothetical protein
MAKSPKHPAGEHHHQAAAHHHAARATTIIKPSIIMILASTKRRKTTLKRLTNIASKHTSTRRPRTNILVNNDDGRRRRYRLLFLVLSDRLQACQPTCARPPSPRRRRQRVTAIGRARRVAEQIFGVSSGGCDGRLDRLKYGTPAVRADNEERRLEHGRDGQGRDYGHRIRRYSPDPRIGAAAAHVNMVTRSTVTFAPTHKRLDQREFEMSWPRIDLRAGRDARREPTIAAKACP